MAFLVDFNWASQAIIETVAIPFPSLEAPTGTVVADPPKPQLEFQTSGPVIVTDLGNGRWNRDTSYRFNAGCNDDLNHAPTQGELGMVTTKEADELKDWFLARYPASKPQVLPGAQWNFVLVRNQTVYNFHILVKD